MELSERKKQILKSLIDAYISTGEPVGSKLLSGQIALSSATIRNELNELEQLGLLEQLHTSSGRIPSNEGYRVYVENLMSRYRLTIEEIKIINSLMTNKLREFRDIMSETTRLLSHLTRYTAISLTAKSKKITISKFEGIFIDQNSFILIMMISENSAKTRLINTETFMDSGSLILIITALNDNLTDIEASQITLDKIMRLEKVMGQYKELLSPILRVIYEVMEDNGKYQINIDGVSNLLDYPEFSDIAKARELMCMLEERDTLIKRLMNSHGDSLKIYIGSEDDGLDSSSFVVKTFTTENSIIGAVGIIGPKRMDYSGVIARLEYIAEHFSKPGSENDPVSDEINRKDNERKNDGK
ncbi:MAG: heat-inducible transcriptional repressor HrcA [Oscillospiraceae bacterium]|nr:heat-inducible transcriptional repressor HrcA [Oscillospiraceae bacterium]